MPGGSPELGKRKLGLGPFTPDIHMFPWVDGLSTGPSGFLGVTIKIQETCESIYI